MSNYGLKVFDTRGNSSLVIPKLAQIISNGTVTMPNALNGDGTYGVDIDLPGDENINNGDLGMIVQVRDFDWRVIINQFTYATNKYWNMFYGDDNYTYYEKDTTTGIMTAWTPGDLSGGDITEWNPLIKISPIAGWDKYGSSSKAMRIFAAIHYGFLYPYAGSTATTTLYARNTTHTINTVLGYKLLEVQGAIEATTSSKTTPLSWYIHQSTTTKFYVSIVHGDGSETLIGNGIASDTWSWTIGGDTTQQSQRTGATWSCPATTLDPTDAIKLRLHMTLVTYQGTVSGYIGTFITEQLNWSKLNAATWTIPRYVWIYQKFQAAYGYVTSKCYFGSASKEIKITGLSYKPLSHSTKSVATIGSNGVSEVDYVIYMKNYKGN